MKTKYLFAPFALLVLSACSGGDEPAAPFDDSEPVEIALAATMTAESRAGTGPVSGTNFKDGDGPAVFAYQTTSTATTAVSSGTLYLTNIQTKKKENENKFQFYEGSQLVHKYYPEKGEKLSFYAYYPRVDGAKSPSSISFTLDGQMDVMGAPANNENNLFQKARGTDTQKQPHFAFTHLLQQLQFKLAKGTGFSDDVTVSEIKVTNTPLSCTLDATKTSGQLSFPSPNSHTAVSIKNSDKSWKIDKAADATDNKALGSVLMVYPTEKIFNIEVVASNGVTYKATADLTAISDAGQAGKSHLITLTFKGSEIEPTCSMTAWSDGQGKDVSVY